MITLRSAIFGSATETRPIGSDRMSRRFCPVSSGEVLDRADLAIDSDRGRRGDAAVAGGERRVADAVRA